MIPPAHILTCIIQYAAMLLMHFTDLHRLSLLSQGCRTEIQIDNHLLTLQKWLKLGLYGHFLMSLSMFPDLQLLLLLTVNLLEFLWSDMPLWNSCQKKNIFAEGSWKFSAGNIWVLMLRQTQSRAFLLSLFYFKYVPFLYGLFSKWEKHAHISQLWNIRTVKFP